MARRQDYPTLGEAIADYDADVVEFLPVHDPQDIAALRGSGVRTMIAYNGNEEEVFARMIETRPDLFNLNRPFEFTRFARSPPGYG